MLGRNGQSEWKKLPALPPSEDINIMHSFAREVQGASDGLIITRRKCYMPHGFRCLCSKRLIPTPRCQIACAYLMFHPPMMSVFEGAG